MSPNKLNPKMIALARESRGLTQLELAESFWQRGKGLLGHSKLEFDQALWIKPCNNIHTMFMRFSIDCIFLEKKLANKFSLFIKNWEELIIKKIKALGSKSYNN